MYEYYVFVVSTYIAHFLIGFNLITIAFWLITIGMIVTFVATKKKGIDENKWKWVTLLAAEACGLILSFLLSKWFSGIGALSVSSLNAAARAGTVLFLGELTASILVLRCAHNKEIKEFVFPADFNAGL